MSLVQIIQIAPTSELGGRRKRSTGALLAGVRSAALPRMQLEGIQEAELPARDWLRVPPQEIIPGRASEDGPKAGSLGANSVHDPSACVVAFWCLPRALPVAQQRPTVDNPSSLPLLPLVGSLHGTVHSASSGRAVLPRTVSSLAASLVHPWSQIVRRRTGAPQAFRGSNLPALDGDPPLVPARQTISSFLPCKRRLRRALSSCRAAVVLQDANGEPCAHDTRRQTVSMG